MVKQIGFRPNEEDLKRLEYLQGLFQEGSFNKVTNSDVLRFALKVLYEQHEPNQDNRIIKR